MTVEFECPAATDGAIAAINLEGACRSAWVRFTENAFLPGAAESLIDMERLRGQFLGNPDALDRLEMLGSQFSDDTARAVLIKAEVASTAHRFDDARSHLARAARLSAASEAVERQLLALDQACGVELDRVVDARRKIAAARHRLEDLVPLGAVLADLERFDEADSVYRAALQAYADVSPFPLAWVCFQLGMLWGELAPQADQDLAARWYELAIAYLPAYAKARVHLAEIRLSENRTADAEALLLPALASRDPEVSWRLADVLSAQERFEEAATQLCAAWRGFDRLVTQHPLAFADHAAEFYAGSGNNSERALKLARMNVANRPTRRAIEQLRAIEAKTDEGAAARAA